MHLRPFAGLAATALFTTACVVDDVDDLTSPDEIATTESEIIGFANSGPLAGIIKIDVTGQADTYTGLLLGDNLVVTSSRWMSWQTAPNSVTLVSGPGNSSAQTRSGRFVNSSAFFPAAVVQVSPYTSGHANTYPIDTRPSSALHNVLLRCYEYVGNQLRYADMRVTGSSGDDLTLSGTLGTTTEDADAGAPCIDFQTFTAVAMITGAPGGTPHAHRLGAMQPWLDGLHNLAATRTHSSSSKLALYTRAPDGTRMCLDIPWGSPFEHEAINAYPCHYGPAQRFWLDYRVDSGRPRLVSDSSGRCADVPSSSLVSGTNYQQFGCHAGLNQRFDLSVWLDATGGWKLKPAHAPAQNLCLSVEGGASSQSRPTEQRTCTGSADQRWFPVWNPVFVP